MSDNKILTADNGDLYNIILYTSGSPLNVYIKILLSVDYGLTWREVFNDTFEVALSGNVSLRLDALVDGDKIHIVYTQRQEDISPLGNGSGRYVIYQPDYSPEVDATQTFTGHNPSIAKDPVSGDIITVFEAV